MITPSKLEGWTISEAIDRCVDPDFHRAYDEAVAKWRAEGAPTNPVFRSTYLDGAVAELANSRARHESWLHTDVISTSAQLPVCLVRLLERMRLLAWGRPGSPLAEPVPFPPPAWKWLKIRSTSRSSVAERTRSRTEYFDVRIFPVVDAPNAMDVLADKSLAVICREFILGDPEVETARKRELASEHESLANPEAPTPGVLPGAATREDFVADRVPGLGQTVGHPHSDIIATRMRSLIGRFVTGEFAATVQAGAGHTAVLQGTWRSKRHFIDLDTGDLLQLGRARQPKVLLQGLVLRRPEAVAALRAQDGKAVLRARTSAKASRECFDWLCGQMRRSPNRRPKPKPKWWVAAEKRWGQSLSRNAFDDIWRRAIQETGALAWSFSGAPRKAAKRKSSH